MVGVYSSTKIKAKNFKVQVLLLTTSFLGISDATMEKERWSKTNVSNFYDS
jgi:hypothetical protein